MPRKRRNLKPLIDHSRDEPTVREVLKRPRLDTPSPTSDDDENANFDFSELSLSNDPTADIPIVTTNDDDEELGRLFRQHSLQDEMLNEGFLNESDNTVLGMFTLDLLFSPN